MAVLDTGLDQDHPDLQGRAIVSRSFIPGQDVHDDNGHGTHCIGTACGPRQPPGGRGYGVAFEAELFAGEVLSNQGSALGRSTLAGIEWAVTNGCHIISMSLGSPVNPGQRFSNAFETLAREALRRNTLIIAAAGNESRRQQGLIAPVGSPANCPSILAVAALDNRMRLGDFSNGSMNPDSRVDIAGPGVAIYSSAPDPAAPRQPPGFRQWAARHDTISGTSMATPHVSGIAALLYQANPHTTAAEIWRQLIVTAQTLPLPGRDIGAGLVQAPYNPINHEENTMPRKPISSPSQTPETHVLVCVEASYRDQLEAIARQLQQAGMHVAELFPIGGTIAGTAPARTLPALQAVKGVASVEEEPTFEAY